MTRRGKGPLIPVLNAHNQEVLRILGVPSGRDRTLAEARTRKADTIADKPKKVAGGIRSGDAVKNLIATLELQGVIIDQTDAGASYGDILYNPIIVNPVTPIFTHLPQITADTASTTNTASTVAAASKDIVLPDGIWSVLSVASLELQRSVVGSSRMSNEIAGTESLSGAFLLPFTTGTNATHTTVWERKTYGLLLENIAGAQTIAVRVRYRSETSGTTSAQNPHIMVYTWRTS